MSDALIDEHDAALFDLDGVVYLGPDRFLQHLTPLPNYGVAGSRSASSPIMPLVRLRL